MDKDVLFLADPEGTVSGLIFHGRIPPTVKVYDMAGGGEGRTYAAGFDGDDEERWAVGGLETLDRGTPGRFFTGVPPCRMRPGWPMCWLSAPQRNSKTHFLELGENEHALLALCEL